MEIDTYLTDEELERRAWTHGVKISCLSRYYQNPEQAVKHSVVLNYSGIDVDKMQRAMEVLGQCVDKTKEID